MAVVDFHVLAQAVLYFSVFICGFCVAIPIGLNGGNFNMCVLYTDTTYDSTKNLILIPGSDASKCNFPIYFSVFGLIIYGLLGGLYNGYAVAKSFKEPEIGETMWVLPGVLANAVICFLDLISACMVSVGFKYLCDGLTKHYDEAGFWKECKDAQNVELKYTEDGNTGEFYRLLKTAEVAAWFSFLFLLLLTALYVLRFFRNRRSQRQKDVKTETPKTHEVQDNSFTDKY